MVSSKFEIPIFKGTVTLYYGKDLEYVQRKYKTKDLSNYGAVTMHNPKNNFKDYIVAFCRNNNDLISHEVVHLVNFLYIDVGLELDRYNDETQAYLSGYFFEKIEDFLHKHNNRIWGFE